MKLTKRQRRFLELASQPEGQSPVFMPPGGAYLRSRELRPLTDADLVRHSDEHSVWITTAVGKAMLTKENI